MRIVVLALVVLMLPATALASWSVHGDVEPSTDSDVSSGLMYADPATGADERVYFNVVENAGPTGLDPNAQEVSRIGGGPAPSYGAFLGAWRDCNNDGFIGMVDGAVMEYSSSLLLDTSICPPGQSEHNKDGWVYEILWIGPPNSVPHPGADTYAVPRLLGDNDARVWGDRGLPDGAPPASSCPLTPIPQGTTSDTGRLIGDVDCFDDRAIADAIDSNDPTGALAFGDPDHPERSSNLLVQHAPVSTFGDPDAPGRPTPGILQKDSGRAAFTAWDCSQPHGESVNDPSGGSLSSITLTDPEPGTTILVGKKGIEGIAEMTIFARDSDDVPRYHQQLADNGSYVYLPAPAPTEDPSGSLYDGANETEFGAVEHCDAHRDSVPSWKTGTLVSAYPRVEDPNVGVTPSDGRRRSDVVFDFIQNQFSNQESGTVTQGALGAPAIGDITGHAMPQDLGIAEARFAAGGVGPGWDSVGPGTFAPDTRADLSQLAPRYMTFYAHVGAATLSRGIGVPGLATYGSPWCGSFTSGAHDGWDCDASHWWTPPYSAAMPRNPNGGYALGVAPGQRYELRDVDCHDDTVETVGTADLQTEPLCS